MPNSTRQAGYLTATSKPIEGQALRRAIQQWLAGVTGLHGAMVRPRFQKNAPPWPDNEVNWLAFNESNRTPIGNNFQRDTLTLSHVSVEFTIRTYGPEAAGIASDLRDGCQLGNNRDQLRQYGFGFTKISPAVMLGDEDPNGEYRDCWQMTLTLQREEIRDYNLDQFMGASGTIRTDTGTIQPYTVTN